MKIKELITKLQEIENDNLEVLVLYDAWYDNILGIERVHLNKGQEGEYYDCEEGEVEECVLIKYQ